MLNAATTVLRGVKLALDDGSPIVACSDKEAAPWTIIANAAAGAQLHDHLAHSVGQATVKDSRDALTRMALAIFVTMLAVVTAGGIGVILPNLQAARRLQGELTTRLHTLPLAVRQVGKWLLSMTSAY